MRNKILIVLGVVALLAAGCNGKVAAPPQEQGQLPGDGTVGHPLVTLTINTASTPELGQFLVGPNGMTLYLYTKDAAYTSNCYDTCAANWPPYIVTSPERLNGGVGTNTSKIGTIKRTDGSLQVTYDGAPLYYWKNDKNPGDTTGQNVGKVWFVVKP